MCVYLSYNNYIFKTNGIYILLYKSLIFNIIASMELTLQWLSFIFQIIMTEAFTNVLQYMFLILFKYQHEQQYSTFFQDTCIKS